MRTKFAAPRILPIRRWVALVNKSFRQCPADGMNWVVCIIGVVPGLLTRRQDMESVMDVVIPLRRIELWPSVAVPFQVPGFVAIVFQD